MSFCRFMRTCCLPVSGRRQRRPSLLLQLAILALTALAIGCAGPRPQPPLQVIPGYLGLREDFRNRDLSPLAGRRIVIDPGHGGHFAGAVGPNGLTEASVNLGVAHYLRGLLEWAGAEVWLTRTADVDFLSPADSTLATDLAFRVAFTDSLQPDVFISIHHNSNAALDRSLNETQTYYRMDDDGASLDLARAIHRHLVLNLEIYPAKILPGNFHVLRNATVPAVLGEPAMLSHPVIEGRLSLAASQELEAVAYFLGLLDYFAGGTPCWSGAALDTVVVADPAAPPAVNWQFLPAGPEDPDADHVTAASNGDPGPQPATFSVLLDGRPTPWRLSSDGFTVSWLPQPLGEGQHVLSIGGRNLAGRATPPRRTLLQPAVVHRIEVITPAPGSPEPAPALLHSWTADGSPVSSGSGSSAWQLIDLKEIELMRQDLAAPARSDAEPAAQTSFAELPAGLSWHLMCDPGDTVHPIGTDLPARWYSRLAAPAAGTSQDPARTDWPAIALSPDSPVWIEIPGALPLIDPQPDEPDAPRTVAADEAYWPVAWLAPELKNQVIVIDPAAPADGTYRYGPLGVRAADLNLNCAQWAARLLRGAGAQVVLTREGEIPLSDPQKVRLANDLNADLFLALGRSDSTLISVRHHPGSSTGERWAMNFAAAIDRLDATDALTRPQPAYDYLLRHTACPALSVDLPLPVAAVQEMQMLQPAWAQAEARAVLLGILATVGGRDDLPPTRRVVDLLADLPPQALCHQPALHLDRVVIDGNFAWTPGRTLAVTEPMAPQEKSAANAFATTGYSLVSMGDPGLPERSRHTLELHAGSHWQVWLLEQTVHGPRARLLLARR